MSLLDAPERFASWVGDVIRENFKTVLGLLGLLWLALMFDVVSIPNVGIPLWVRVVGTFGAVSALAGYVLASLKFDEPEPDWNYIVEVNIDAAWFMRIRKVTDPVIADMQVVKGRLRNPRGSSIYVCRWWNHDLENPIAHSSWTDVPDDAELLGTKPSAIEDEIRSLRDTYEDTHGKHRWVLDHLYMVVRKLDLRRTKSQNAVLEDHLAPSMEGDSIADVVDDVVPEDIRPDSFDGPENTRDGDRREEAFEEVESELTETAASEAASQPTVADGGQPDE